MISDKQLDYIISNVIQDYQEDGDVRTDDPSKSWNIYEEEDIPEDELEEYRKWKEQWDIAADKCDNMQDLKNNHLDLLVNFFRDAAETMEDNFGDFDDEDEDDDEIGEAFRNCSGKCDHRASPADTLSLLAMDDELDEANDSGDITQLTHNDAVKRVERIFKSHNIKVRTEGRSYVNAWVDDSGKPYKFYVMAVMPSEFKYRTKSGYVTHHPEASKVDPTDPKSFLAVVVYGEEGLSASHEFFIPAYRLAQPDGAGRWSSSSSGKDYYIRVNDKTCDSEFAEFHWTKVKVNEKKAEKALGE